MAKTAPPDVFLAARCRELRRERLALTQREWAARLGVTPVTVARWELGRGGPSLPMIRRMAASAELPVSWFFEGKEQET